jgi:hypothetical protein
MGKTGQRRQACMRRQPWSGAWPTTTLGGTGGTLLGAGSRKARTTLARWGWGDGNFG